MNDEYELEMSPLCQDVTEGDDGVRIEIYRGESEGWFLEVVDAYGNSTVWEDEFPTDAAALEEAMATIREEGIGVLIGSETGS